MGPRPADWPQECACYRIAIKTDDGTEVAEGEYESAPISSNAMHIVQIAPSIKKLRLVPTEKMDIIFAHTPNYPDEPPLVKVSRYDGQVRGVEMPHNHT